MTSTDLSPILAPFVLTLSQEEQEFVATHNLLGKRDWPTCVPAGLVPQAIAYYIQQKTNRYLHDLFHAPNDDGPEVRRPKMKKKSVRQVRNEDTGV